MRKAILRAAAAHRGGGSCARAGRGEQQHVFPRHRSGALQRAARRSASRCSSATSRGTSRSTPRTKSACSCKRAATDSSVISAHVRVLRPEPHDAAEVKRGGSGHFARDLPQHAVGHVAARGAGQGHDARRRSSRSAPPTRRSARSNYADPCWPGRTTSMMRLSLSRA